MVLMRPQLPPVRAPSVWTSGIVALYRRLAGLTAERAAAAA
jgi:hypothetical protein